MEIGLGRKLSGITFSQAGIEKSLTKHRRPSDFWGKEPDGGVQIVSEKDTSKFAEKKPCRDDIKITGSVLKKPVK